MFPKGGDLVCKKCGHKVAGTKEEAEAAKVRSLTEERPRVVVNEDEESVLPKTRNACPKCSHNEAYWMMQQTRKADEAPTRFYICVRCKHRWREYN
jgi:DNA-directed RNA polymerase subunit M